MGTHGGRASDQEWRGKDMPVSNFMSVHATADLKVFAAALKEPSDTLV